MNLQKTDMQHRKMTTENVRSLILRFAVPTTLGMLLISLYSLADAFFVSNLGTVASAAVGVTFAIQALLQAVGYTLGMGAASLMSRSLGCKKSDDARHYAQIAFWLSILAGAAIAVLGSMFLSPLMRLLGARDATLPYAVAYGRYLVLSAPFTCASFVLSQTLRAEGKAVFSMVGLAGGSLLNIALDPILIDRCGMGIAGASLATLISQAFSLAILLSAYLFGHSSIHLLEKGRFLKGGAPVLKILRAGIPSAFRQGLTVLATVLLNRAASTWGDAAIASLSIVTRLFLLSFSFCLGIGQGMMPVTGFNYGYGKKDRVKSAYRFSLLLSSAAMLLCSIVLFSFAPRLIALFRNDPDVIKIGSVALRAQSAVLVLHGSITCTIMLLQALGKPLQASVIACARQGLFFVPLIFLLPRLFGVESVLFIQPIADGLTFLLAIPFIIFLMRSLTEKAPAKQSVGTVPRAIN